MSCHKCLLFSFTTPILKTQITCYVVAAATVVDRLPPLALLATASSTSHFFYNLCNKHIYITYVALDFDVRNAGHRAYTPAHTSDTLETFGKG